MIYGNRNERKQVMLKYKNKIAVRLFIICESLIYERRSSPEQIQVKTEQKVVVIWKKTEINAEGEKSGGSAMPAWYQVLWEYLFSSLSHLASSFTIQW